MKQSGAGCDGFDSDGDGIIDNCEDRTPPRLILTESTRFQCDLTDLDKLCYNQNTFMEYTHAEAYILKNVQVSDECAARSELSIDMELTDTTTCDILYGKTTIMQNVLSLLLFSNVTHPTFTSRIGTEAVLPGPRMWN